MLILPKRYLSWGDHRAHGVHGEYPCSVLNAVLPAVARMDVCIAGDILTAVGPCASCDPDGGAGRANRTDGREQLERTRGASREFRGRRTGTTALLQN